MSVANTLMRKYGIQRPPTDPEIDRWVTETERLLKLGVDGEASGAEAAEMIFRDIDLKKLDSHAGNIIEVLEQAKKRA